MFYCKNAMLDKETQWYYDATDAKREAAKIVHGFDLSTANTHEVNSIWQNLKKRGWKLHYELDRAHDTGTVR